LLRCTEQAKDGGHHGSSNDQRPGSRPLSAPTHDSTHWRTPRSATCPIVLHGRSRRTHEPRGAPRPRGPDKPGARTCWRKVRQHILDARVEWIGSTPPRVGTDTYWSENKAPAAQLNGAGAVRLFPLLRKLLKTDAKDTTPPLRRRIDLFVDAPGALRDQRVNCDGRIIPPPLGIKVGVEVTSESYRALEDE
jgi:hypothetical protein